MNKRIFKDETSMHGEIPFYKIRTFGETADAYISRKLFEEYKEKYPYPKKGDILLSTSGSIGKIVEFDGKDAYFQDSNIVWFDHKNKLCNKFLKQYYQVINWNGLEGTTIKRLYNKDILNTYIYVPKIQKQAKLGEFFFKVEKLIDLYERKFYLFNLI